MNILNSSWLLGVLDKSSPSAQQRLLNLFDILDDWLQASQIDAGVDWHLTPANEPSHALLQYLTEQCSAIYAQAPETLAHQIYCMALGALQQEVHTPRCGSLLHARQAAQALIEIQLTHKQARHGHYAYALAASIAFIAALSAYLMFTEIQREPTGLLQAELKNPQLSEAMPALANPAHTAEMFASLERMRAGVCHYPEALMLPENQRSVYMRNVVGGEVSSDAAEQALAIQLMQRVSCNYAPMLMKNSTS